ncbi:MAG: glycerophosphodiester phosphodiesterase family protein [bacterium]
MRPALPAGFLTSPIAHRGYHDAASRRPENSVSAFQAAVEAGYGIELDVQLTRDGQAMVFHDDTLDRMTGRPGAVRDYTAAELGQIRLLDSDDLIPTLAQVLGLVAGRTPLLIELKDLLDTMAPTSGRLEQASVTALSGYEGPAALMSFNPHCIATVNRLAPQIPRGLTTEYYDHGLSAPIPPAICDRLREIPDYDPTGCTFISHRHTDLDQPRVAALKAQGAAILCWTIKSPQDEAKARKIAHNITFEGYPAPFIRP